jgi:hypothetical protein
MFWRQVMALNWARVDGTQAFGRASCCFAVRPERLDATAQFLESLGFGFQTYGLADVSLRVKLDWDRGVELVTPMTPEDRTPGSVAEFLADRVTVCFPSWCESTTLTGQRNSPSDTARPPFPTAPRWRRLGTPRGPAQCGIRNAIDAAVHRSALTSDVPDRSGVAGLRPRAISPSAPCAVRRHFVASALRSK